MFCKKLVLIAATAALALGSISAKQESKIHVRVHANSKAVCSAPGQSPMSVEGVEGVFCVTGQACVANISNGSCPGPQSGLPNGAVCGIVKTGVYGCKPAPATPQCTGNDVTPMSVEGVEGIFCVNGKACAGQDGACPGPQAGLPNGAFCGTVKTGVLGCKPKTAKHHKHKSASKAVCSGPGQSPMSVEGVEGVYCVTGQACVANINGACPGPQPGLPNGAVCGTVKTGVLGCKPAPAAPQCTGNDVTPMSVEGVEGIFCVNGKACAGQDGACPGPQTGLPNGAYCGTVKTGVLGCKPKTAKHHKHKSHKSSKSHAKNVCSGPGQSPMSVEGVPGVFCVTGQACVADISTGACPGPQDGLPNGAHCGKVITGVYGCQPNADAPKTEAPKTEAPKTEAPKTEAPKTEAPKTEAPKTEAPKVEPAVCSGPGQSPMSVEGVQGVYCVTGQACVADISTGSCPGPQEGLPNGAHCGKVKTGVYGCKPNTDAPTTEAPKTEAPKTEAPKADNVLCSGPGQSPMSVEGVQGIYCVTGQACVANIANGACPGPQEGLPNGAYCGKVKTGVYGCKPTVDAPTTEAPKTEAPKTEAPKTEAPKTEAPKTEAPKTEVSKTEAPVVTSAPPTHAPKTHTPKTHTPKTLTPVVTSAPTTHAPKTHAPASNPSDNHGVVIVDIDVDVNGEDSDDSEDSSDVVYVEDSADSEDSEDSSDSSDDRRL